MRRDLLGPSYYSSPLFRPGYTASSLLYRLYFFVFFLRASAHRTQPFIYKYLLIAVMKNS